MLNLTEVRDPYELKSVPSYSEVATRLHDNRGRSASGKYTWKGALSVMADDDFPPDSPYWRRYALGAIDATIDVLGDDAAHELRELVFPNITIQSFTWRTICEMLEESLKLARAGERDLEKLAAVAHAKLEQLVKDKK